MRKLSELIVLIRGGGEVASGIAHRLHTSHIRVCLTEVANPLAVSRGTTFSEAIFDGVKTIEEVTAELVPASPEEIYRVWQQGKIPVVIIGGSIGLDKYLPILDRGNIGYSTPPGIPVPKDGTISFVQGIEPSVASDPVVGGIVSDSGPGISGLPRSHVGPGPEDSIKTGQE